MTQRLRAGCDAHRWLLTSAGASLLAVGLGTWWVLRSRPGYPLDIDEAGYLTIAVKDHLGLGTSGLSGWWHAIVNQYPNAPLVPALASLAFVVRTNLVTGFAVELAFLAVLGMASYGIGRRILGPRLAALGASTIVLCPGATGYSREFIFALPATALLAVAVWAMLGSEGLRRPGWSVGTGVALGATLLVRTVAVTVVVVILAVALLSVLVAPDARRRRLRNLLLLGGAGFAVAAPWYLPNLHAVVHYLTQYGYGVRSVGYGPRASVLTVTWWRREWDTLVAEDLLAPLALLVLAGLLATTITTVRRLRIAPNRRAGLLGSLRSDAATVTLVLAGSYLALTSSRNRGAGFALMLVPCLVVAALIGVRRAPGRVVAVLVGLILAISALNLAALSDVSTSLSRTRAVDVPVLGRMIWMRGTPNALKALRRELAGPSDRFVATDREWPLISRRVARRLISDARVRGREPVVAFGMVSRVFNTNTVALAAALDLGISLPVAQLDPRDGNTRRDFARFLNTAADGEPNLLLTALVARGDFRPYINVPGVIAAARQVGFRPIDRFRLPDGRTVTVWWLVRGPVAADASRARSPG